MTSFVLHADVYHLIGNLAVLLMFGLEAEEVLGAGRFLLLVALAALAGDLLFIAVQHGSSVPSVGASGGISGVLVYWAFAFPRSRVRLGMFSRYSFEPVAISLSARDALFCWVALQLALATLQSGSGAMGGGINALAHLGGGAVGWAFWMRWPD